MRDNQRNLCYGKDHGESGIFSFYKWESRARNSKLEVPRNNGFIYIICTFIASFINNKFNCKNVNTGCIYDYIHQKYHINTGMIKTHICSDCKKNIKDRNSIEYKTIRKNLDVLMKELSEASSLEMDILDFWSDKTEEELEQLVEGKPSTNKLTEEELNENLEISQLVEALTSNIEFTEEQLGEKILLIQSLHYLRKLEEKMKDLTPEKRPRISTYIERGAISDRIKEKYNKCLVCEALGEPKLGFKKRNSELYYIESHHVEEVSQLKKGSLSIANIITVCANHHRQMHYGNVDLIKEKSIGDSFTFKIDGEDVIIPKITI